MENKAENKQVKTYTERFKEMEDQLAFLVNTYSEANQAFSITASIVQDLAGQIRSLNDQLQAVYDVAADHKLAITRDQVADKVNAKRTKRVQDLIDKDEQEGLIKEIETVLDDKSVVLYSTDDISLAFRAVMAFETEELKNSLIGKKKGDKVGDLEIKKVYQIVEPATEQA